MTHIAIRPLLRGDLPRVAHLVDANAMFPSEMLEDSIHPAGAALPG